MVPQAAGTVLHIDDRPSNLRLMCRILEDRPAVTVLSTTSGAEGLRLARERKPSLVLLDLHLRDMRGEAVLRRLAQDQATQGIPVVIMSADTAPETAERLIRDGASAYLRKPVDIDELLRVVDEQVHGRRIP